MPLIPFRGGRVLGKKLWGLDRFGSVHECVDWGKGPVGHFIHEIDAEHQQETGTGSKETEEAWSGWMPATIFIHSWG